MKKRKLIDERGFLFGKISVVDIMAVALVAAIGVMVYVRFFTQGDENVGYSNPEMVKVEYVVKVTSARDCHANAFRPGDTVYNGDEGPLLGSVTDVRTEPAHALVSTPGGKILSMPMEGYSDIYITVESQCTTGANGYYLGGSIELNRNMAIQLTTIYDSVTGVVVSVG